MAKYIRKETKRKTNKQGKKDENPVHIFSLRRIVSLFMYFYVYLFAYVLMTDFINIDILMFIYLYWYLFIDWVLLIVKAYTFYAENLHAVLFVRIKKHPRVYILTSCVLWFIYFLLFHLFSWMLAVITVFD